MTPTPTPTTTGPTIVVGGDSQYTTIQQGIQAAENAGIHNIVIDAGTYNENDTLTAADNGLSISASGAVTLTGSFNISNASGITLSGLTFQGNGGNVAIDALNSQNVTVTGDTFNGTYEAVLLDGTGNSTVSNNTITNTSFSSIEAKNGANGDTITENVITNDNAANTVGAIFLHGTDNSAITHNQITNTTGAAISLEDFGEPGDTSTQNNNATIAYNTLNQVDTQSSDSGAIYILGRSQNTGSNDTVTMNFIGATGSPGAHAIGIYLDDNASGVSVTRNIVQATPSMSHAFQIHGGSDDTVSGNIFDLGTGSTNAGLLQQDEPDQQPQGNFQQLQNDTVTGNIFTTESTNPANPAFADVTSGIGDVSISANDYWGFNGASLNAAGSGASGDTNAKTVAPASQAATSLGSYSSWSGAGINFQPINTSNIGL